MVHSLHALKYDESNEVVSATISTTSYEDNYVFETLGCLYRCEQDVSWSIPIHEGRSFTERDSDVIM
ncbi:hypothetical protein C482_20131 [Natrialba chahannaoensis JCM 10990]|uniref:Uncharacterized protein n=1 Tax=Natrialba chahannaoensis JCM 10990 TaxID=1227492 RepID=M0A370_9EURY|nr:hypothetical protein C482_20131 [Natrialba chahannaoensis JCM 10990]